jgi:hypothetical protein
MDHKLKFVPGYFCDEGSNETPSYAYREEYIRVCDASISHNEDWETYILINMRREDKAFLFMWVRGTNTRPYKLSYKILDVVPKEDFYKAVEKYILPLVSDPAYYTQYTAREAKESLQL